VLEEGPLPTGSLRRTPRAVKRIKVGGRESTGVQRGEAFSAAMGREDTLHSPAACRKRESGTHLVRKEKAGRGLAENVQKERGDRALSGRGDQFFCYKRAII